MELWQDKHGGPGPRNAAGKEHGRGALVSIGGSRSEGKFVNGVKQGRWVEAGPFGARHEGEYVDGRTHGRWSETVGGLRSEGCYLIGACIPPFTRHGPWVMSTPDGTAWETQYYHGVTTYDKKVRAPQPIAPRRTCRLASAG
jgi:hypothetical protein